MSTLMTKKVHGAVSASKLFKDLSMPLPNEPGTYFWSEWGANVQVTKRGRFCYVTPPGRNRMEIKITKRIAGCFVKVKE